MEATVTLAARTTYGVRTGMLDISLPQAPVVPNYVIASIIFVHSAIVATSIYLGIGLLTNSIFLLMALILMA
jgi:hypothetical protein